MQLSCLQENLRRGLTTVGRAIAGKSTLPVLSNVLLETDAGRLKLAATNLDIGVTTWIGAKIDREGALTAPAKLLTDIICGLPNEIVHLYVDSRTQALHIRCCGTTVALKGIAADEFPVLPPGPERTPDAIFPADALCDAIRQVAFATTTDDTRPTLTGVSLHIDSRTATLTAADGYRLARRTLTLAEAAPSQLNTIIPARTLMELARCIGDNSGNVYVTPTPSGGQVIFHTVDLEIVSRIINGVYPDMSRIIPHTYATHALLDRQELRASVNGAALIAAAAANVLSLQLEPGDHQSLGTVTISAHAAEVGEHSTVLEGAITGESGRLLLNAGYVADVVEAIPSAQVILEMQTAQSPAVFRAVGADDYVCVIMPMHMR